MWLQLSDEHVNLLKRHLEDAVPLTEDEATQLLGRLEQYQLPETNDPVYRTLAGSLPFTSDGECEIDDEAVVSWSEDGAYVMAWVWVESPYKDVCPDCGRDYHDDPLDVGELCICDPGHPDYEEPKE